MESDRPCWITAEPKSRWKESDDLDPCGWRNKMHQRNHSHFDMLGKERKKHNTEASMYNTRSWRVDVRGCENQTFCSTYILFVFIIEARTS